MAVFRSSLRQRPGARGASPGARARILPLALAVAASSGSLLAVPASAQTGPVLCTTTLEAPLVRPGQPARERGGPREVTRCGVVGTVPDLVRQRYYSYRAPFARGVDLTHQITDFFGLAMGGGDGTRLMGLGFPDQAIIWDGVAIENTNRFLMDQQVQLVPRRTADLPSPFTTSVRTEDGRGSSSLPYPDTGLQPR
ncbi:MAG: Occludin/ELL family protein [Cyanobacteriota bacterium]|nr:Occludin/ELL family protein [Cyanobacteriota bacterium]